MNKLEKLKTLIAEEKKWRREWINAEIASDDREDLWSLRQEYYSAKRNRSALSDELLPQLIAVAEAAAKVGCTLNEHTLENMRHLQNELEPLIEDADK